MELYTISSRNWASVCESGSTTADWTVMPCGLWTMLYIENKHWIAIFVCEVMITLYSVGAGNIWIFRLFIDRGNAFGVVVVGRCQHRINKYVWLCLWIWMSKFIYVYLFSLFSFMNAGGWKITWWFFWSHNDECLRFRRRRSQSCSGMVHGLHLKMRSISLISLNLIDLANDTRRTVFVAEPISRTVWLTQVDCSLVTSARLRRILTGDGLYAWFT